MLMRLVVADLFALNSVLLVSEGVVCRQDLRRGFALQSPYRGLWQPKFRVYG